MHPLVAAVIGFWLLALARQWVARLLTAPPPPTRPGLLGIIVPVRDEAAAIPHVLRRTPTADLVRQGWRPRIIVVDDGSRDGSGSLARAAGAHRVIRHERGRGLGAALRTGLRAACEEGCVAAVYLDGDGEYDAAQMGRLLLPIVEGKADYVLGSRFRGQRRGMTRLRTMGNLAFTALMVAVTGHWMTDAQTGYRAFSRRALERAEIIHDYNYAQVLTLDLLRKGMRMAETPIDYQVRTAGRSFVRAPEYLVRVLPAIAWQLVRP